MSLVCVPVWAADGAASNATASALTIILAALLAVSEALALIPGLKSDSVFQLIVNILKTLAGKGTGI